MDAPAEGRPSAMQKLLEPEAIELEPEAQAAVDEVCEAVSDPWGAPTGLGERFKFALYSVVSVIIRERR